MEENTSLESLDSRLCLNGLIYSTNLVTLPLEATGEPLLNTPCVLYYARVLIIGFQPALHV